MSTTEDHKKMNVYELGYSVLPSVPGENIPQVVSNIVSIIEKAGAKTLDSENPGLEALAYSISKTVGARKYVVDEAYIGWIKFETRPNLIEEIKTGVEKMEEILRVLLIKAPRETTFTFAKARAEKADKETPAPTLVEDEAEAPTPESVGIDEPIKESIVE